MVLCGGSWLVNRWLVLVASLALEVCGGAMYAYPLYSTSLRNTLGYAQWQVAALALASNIGNFCNIPSGIVMDLYGVRATVLCGVCVNFVGYFLLWLVATEAISAPFEAVFAISMLWGNGAGWFDTAVIAVNMSNFPECRGIVVGLLKSFFGLASAVLSLGFFAFFNPMGGGDDPETRTPEQLRVGAEAFILFLAVALSSLGLFLVPLLNHTPTPLPESTTSAGVRRRLLIAYGIVVTIAAGLGLVSLAAANVFGEGLVPELPPTRYRVFAACMCGLLMLFTLLPTGTRPWLYKSAPVPTLPGCCCGPKALPLRTSAVAEVEARKRRQSVNAEDSGDSEAGPPSLSLCEAACDVRFYLLAGAKFCGMGCGLMLLNNVAQVAESLAPEATTANTALFVMIMSTTNCIGRMVWGLGSDVTLAYVDRTAWLVAAIALTAGGMGLGSIGDGTMYNSGTLYTLLFPTAALVGFAYGALWGVVPVLIMEMFGPRHFGTLYTTLAIAPALSSFVIATWLVGDVYDRHARANVCECGFAPGSTCEAELTLCEVGAGPGDDDLCPADSGCIMGAPCMGQRCFQLTFVISCGVAVLGVVLALALQLVSRNVYVRVRAERAFHTAQAAATESEKQPLLTGAAEGSLPEW